MLVDKNNTIMLSDSLPDNLIYPFLSLTFKQILLKYADTQQIL